MRYVLRELNVDADGFFRRAGADDQIDRAALVHLDPVERIGFNDGSRSLVTCLFLHASGRQSCVRDGLSGIFQRFARHVWHRDFLDIFARADINLDYIFSGRNLRCRRRIRPNHNTLANGAAGHRLDLIPQP